MGRPLKYKPEYCQMLIDHMAKGFSVESFAGVVGVHQGTLHDWANPDMFPAFGEDFKEAKEIGKAKSLLFWEKLAIDHVLNETFGNNQGSKSLNTGIWCSNMKNRFGWRDKHPDEVRPQQTVAKIDKNDFDDLLKAARRKPKK